eukprot:3035592-Lingulodinium_polyedra.AAC.1
MAAGILRGNHHVVFLGREESAHPLHDLQQPPHGRRQPPPRGDAVFGEDLTVEARGEAQTHHHAVPQADLVPAGRTN